jgi:hypothetical protein
MNISLRLPLANIRVSYAKHVVQIMAWASIRHKVHKSCKRDHDLPPYGRWKDGTSVVCCTSRGKVRLIRPQLFTLRVRGEDTWSFDGSLSAHHFLLNRLYRIYNISLFRRGCLHASMYVYDTYYLPSDLGIAALWDIGREHSTYSQR